MLRQIELVYFTDMVSNRLHNLFPSFLEQVAKSHFAKVFFSPVTWTSSSKPRRPTGTAAAKLST